METIRFSKMLLIEELTARGASQGVPTKDTFEALEENLSHTHENTFYNITLEKTNDYVWFVFSYGNSLPRNEKITNIYEGTERENERQEYEAELNSQLFVLYHYKTGFLYLSKSNKHRLFVELLKEHTGKVFEAQPIYVDIEEFINKMKECCSVSFTNVRDLFQDKSLERKALADLTGTDAPERFTILAKYNRHNISPFLRKLANDNKTALLSGLIVRGLSEDNFAIVYNADTFEQKYPIHCEKDTNGMFITDNVKENLLKVLEHEES